jgi:hypothetical protein
MTGGVRSSATAAGGRALGRAGPSAEQQRSAGGFTARWAGMKGAFADFANLG